MMHGGDKRSTLPDKDDEVTLIRFRLDKNPEGPHIIDHGPPKGPGSPTPRRVDMLRKQDGPIPVYKHSWGGAWECLGRYQVKSVTEGGQDAHDRSKICGRPIRYVIRLGEAN